MLDLERPVGDSFQASLAVEIFEPSTTFCLKTQNDIREGKFSNLQQHSISRLRMTFGKKDAPGVDAQCDKYADCAGHDYKSDSGAKVTYLLWVTSPTYITTKRVARQRDLTFIWLDSINLARSTTCDTFGWCIHQPNYVMTLHSERLEACMCTAPTSGLGFQHDCCIMQSNESFHVCHLRTMSGNLCHINVAGYKVSTCTLGTMNPPLKQSQEDNSLNQHGSLHTT